MPTDSEAEDSMLRTRKAYESFHTRTDPEAMNIRGKRF
jgi:hypothetical protein